MSLTVLEEERKNSCRKRVVGEYCIYFEAEGEQRCLSRIMTKCIAISAMEVLNGSLCSQKQRSLTREK
jgi:hypothetical protein